MIEWAKIWLLEMKLQKNKQKNNYCWWTVRIVSSGFVFMADYIEQKQKATENLLSFLSFIYLRGLEGKVSSSQKFWFEN